MDTQPQQQRPQQHGNGDSSRSESDLHSSAATRNMEVFFLRHAESEENVKLKALCDVVVSFQSCKLPSWNQVCKTISMFEYELNSMVSGLGKNQLKDMKMILEARGFWKQEFDFIMYSPMVRAAETCHSILPERLIQKSSCLDILREISPIEQLIKSCVTKKIQDFEGWLASTPMSTKRILVVGHCQYFNSLLGMKTLMRNCDVWRSTVTLPRMISSSPPSQSRPSQCVWTVPVLVHRTALSEAHPIGKLLRGSWKNFGGWEAEGAEEDNNTEQDRDVARSGDGVDMDRVDEVVNDLDDNNNEPVCRICQVK